jgi:hypothetical protein
MILNPTPYGNIHTTQATGPDLADLLTRTGATPAVADPALARQLGGLPQMPPGLPMMERVRAEAARAGVPAAGVLMVTAAILDAAACASGILPPALAAVQRPPTVIVGSPDRCAAVLAAAEAVVAAAPGLRSRA